MEGGHCTSPIEPLKIQKNLPDAGEVSQWTSIAGFTAFLVDLVPSLQVDHCGTRSGLGIVYCFSFEFCHHFPVTRPGTHAWQSAITWGKPAFYNVWGHPSLSLSDWVPSPIRFSFLAV